MAITTSITGSMIAPSSSIHRPLVRSYNSPSNAATSFSLQSYYHVNLAGRGSEALMVFASGEITCSYSRTSTHPRPRTVRLLGFPDGISLVDVQSVLSRHFLQNQRDRSIFSYLVELGDGISPHEAASTVLQELASKTEKVAVLATLAHRLIEAKALWKGHPNPSVKTCRILHPKARRRQRRPAGEPRHRLIRSTSKAELYTTNGRGLEAGVVRR